MLLALVASAASAQVRRMSINNPLRGNRVEVMDVYEYDFVDVQPQFPGGERGLMKYINDTREYPYHAYHEKIQGRVLISFIVNVDGSVNYVHVIKGVEQSLNREAVRVIESMPKWKAGKIGGEVVPVHCVLPVVFRR